MDRRRQYVLGALLLVLLGFATLVLGAVLQTVLFAITVAYVLYPFKRMLGRRGFSDRTASGVATLTAFVAVLLVVSPLLIVLYQRREQFIEMLLTLPDTVGVGVGEFAFEIQMEPLINSTIAAVQNIAVRGAVAAPSIALQVALFTIVLYGLLYKPRAIRAAALRLVPRVYHDILVRLHNRTRTTLFSLYVLQAATAVATFCIAAVLFWALGYTAPISLAAIAGILQFIPILGPSLLVIILAANDLLVGNPIRAGAMLVFGLLFISLFPDAVIRTKLAEKTGKIGASLYFIGFVGGILTIGPLGVVIGPLVVALLVEVVLLISEREPVASHPAEGSSISADSPPEKSNGQPSDSLSGQETSSSQKE